ncbi:MAG: FKBP-type peptidyl-prolyl cis-trans isomerase [Thermodesulfobacteriota bacterium]
MKFRWIAVVGIIFLASQVSAQESQTLKSQKEKISYIIGMDIGGNFKKQSVDIDPDILARGVKDALSGAKPQLSDQEAREVMTSFEKEMRAKQEEIRKTVGEKNKIEGEKFLAENKSKEGIQTLPDGLQYKVITPGKGKKPQLTDTVIAHYRGTLIDGTEFDSSYRRGQPSSFPVSGVIRGWTEAVQLMEEGAKWQLFIPPNLAYGDRGAGQVIGPNAVLIFEVELISIQEKKEEKK